MDAIAQYWLSKVAAKLYKLHFYGIDFNLFEHEWSFDWDKKISDEENLRNVAAEDNALTVFSRMKVIDSAHIKNFYRDQHDEGRFDPAGPHDVWADWNDFPPAKQMYDYIRIINDLDFDRLTEFCAEYGVTLKESNMPATLEIVDQKPLIKVGDKQYRLKSLQDGSTLDILEAAMTHPDEQLNATKLRLLMGKPNALRSQNNFNQIFRNNEFGKDNLLNPFAEISSTSFMLKTHAVLTSSQLSAIQKADTN